ncbi:hypothetical protein JX266_005091 [Neoarthrinium moseri]|nr:hypothetical protein JX266_005091 [Neoarthrinium moseri]
MHEGIALSEASRLNKGGSEVGRLFIAEVEVDDARDLQGLSVRTDGQGRRFLPVAAAGVRENWRPDYIKVHEHLKPIFEQADAEGAAFYVDFLISDFRTGDARKGAGAALIRKLKEYSVSRGAKSLFLDCWDGNGRSLLNFYIGQGFDHVADFSNERPDAEDWHGCLARMNL